MRHLGKYLIPYMFENPDKIYELKAMETIEDEDIDDLTIDMVRFLESSKDAKYIDFPNREFVGIQASIQEGDFNYSFMFGYRIKDGYFSYDEEGYEDADGNILINVIYEDLKLHTIQGLVLFPNGEEEYIQYYPVFEKPSLKGRAGEI